MNHEEFQADISIPPLYSVMAEVRHCLKKLLDIQGESEEGKIHAHGPQLKATGRRLHRAARTIEEIGALALALEAHRATTPPDTEEFPNQNP